MTDEAKAVNDGELWPNDTIRRKADGQLTAKRSRIGAPALLLSEPGRK